MRKGWGLPVLICCYCALAGASLGKVIPLLPGIVTDLHASAVQVSLVLSVLAATAVLVAPAAGWIGDRFGDRFMLATGIVVLGVGSLLGALSTDYALLFIGRCIEGAGFVCMLTGTAALMMRCTEGRMQAAGMALFGASIPTGIGVAEALAGLVPDGHWREAFGGHAAVLAFSLPAMLLLPAWRRGAAHAHEKVSALVIYRQVSVLRLAFSLAFLTLAQFGMASLFPVYVRAAHGLSMVAAAGFGAAGLIASIVGSIGSGALLARGGNVRLMAWVSLCVFGAAGLCVFASGLGAAFCIAASIVFFVAGGFANGLVLGVLPRVAPSPAMRGRAGGLVNQFSNLGILIAPPLVFIVFAVGGGAGIVALLLAMTVLTLAAMPLAAASRELAAHHPFNPPLENAR